MGCASPRPDGAGRSTPFRRGSWTSWPSMATPPPCFSFTRLLCRPGSRTVAERVHTASGSSAHYREGTRVTLLHPLPVQHPSSGPSIRERPQAQRAPGLLTAYNSLLPEYSM